MQNFKPPYMKMLFSQDGSNNQNHGRQSSSDNQPTNDQSGSHYPNNSTPREPEQNLKPNYIVAWEVYLWLIFILQMFSWALVLAGKPTFIEYIDPAIKIPSWLIAWCYFRDILLFKSKERRMYFITLLVWEIIYALLTFFGYGGTPYIPQEALKNIDPATLKPGLGAMIEYIVLFMPLYWANWKYIQLPDEKKEQPL